MSLDQFDQQDIDSIWINGELIDWEDATIHVMTHGLNYGTGIFEGIRCYSTDEGPAIFRHRDHYERLMDSAKLIDIEIEYSIDELMQATRDVIADNGFESAMIRPSFFFGYNTLGVMPTGCPTEHVIPAWERPSMLGDDTREAGAEVMISSWRRFHSSQIPNAAKVLGVYINSYLAKNEAHKRGFDEAIMLNKDGDIAEGSGENVFIVKRGEIFTPGLDASILPGITRRTIIEIAESQDYSVEEKPISTGELLTADEVFFTGSGAELTPVTRINDVTIGDGSPGPVTSELQENYFDIVHGREDSYRHWLDIV